MILQTTWRPNRRNITIQEKPDFVPDWVYTEAVSAKRFYNEMWEFWVWEEAKNYNCSQALAEDACIRGLKKAILRLNVVYGPKVGQWYEEFLEMRDIFDRVRHPNYTANLGDSPK